MGASRPSADRLSRRALLARTGLGALALTGGVGALATACARTGAQSGTGAAPQAGGGTSSRPLRLHHDAGVGPLFEPYITDFNERYGPTRVETSYVTADYVGVTQTQLAGGSVDYDVLFADDGYALRWFNNGWISDLSDIDGIDAVLQDISPSLQESLRAPSGELIILPYYRGVELFIYNAEHLDQIGAQPPDTWDEFVDTCRELKGRGVTRTPFSPFWPLDPPGSIWTLFSAEATSAGAAPLFDEALQPNFAQDPAVVRTLERWRLMYEEELVPRDIFTTAYGDIVNIFAGGQSTFTIRYGPQLKGFADPEQSRVASVVRNALMPGETATTLDRGAWWMMTQSTPDRDVAWTLLEYLAHKDSDGAFYVPSNLIAVDLGLQTPYDTVNRSPRVVKAWSEWANTDLLLAQLDNARSLGPVVSQEWYGDFIAEAGRLFQDATRGAISVTDALTQAAAFVDERARL